MGSDLSFAPQMTVSCVVLNAGGEYNDTGTRLRHTIQAHNKDTTLTSCRVSASPCSERCCEPEIEQCAWIVSKLSVDPNSGSQSS